jgi:hypothetical protein
VSRSVTGFITRDDDDDDDTNYDATETVLALSPLFQPVEHSWNYDWRGTVNMGLLGGNLSYLLFCPLQIPRDGRSVTFPNYVVQPSLRS